MTKTNLSPTRMERMRQRVRLQTANHAHDLLKDKSDEMMRTFTQLHKQNVTLRSRVEQTLTSALQKFVVATTQMTPEAINTALTMDQPTLSLTCTTQNIMGLVVPHVEIDAQLPTPKPRLSTPAIFDQALTELQTLTTVLLELANIEKTCNMLANEIQKVRRRINSLEYNLIPNIQDTIKFITMKLDENQRETQVRVMKVKEMQKPAE